MVPTDTWGYYQPTRIVFGPSRIREVGGYAVGRTLVVTTPGATSRGLTEKVVGIVGTERVIVHDRVQANPSMDRLDLAMDELRRESIDTIVAVGGGSAIDTGKVLSIGLAMPGATSRELIARGQALEDVAPIRLIAVPTTAGTGAEVTPFATVWDDAARRKHSLGSARLHPSVAVVDPELALDLPWDATLGPGLDALVQCLEAIWNLRASPITSTLAEHGLALAAPALVTLRGTPSSIAARSDLARAALFSGLAISQTRTALAHSMSYPITAHHGLPHGLACALVGPAVLEFNLAADDGRLSAAIHRATGADEPIGWMLDRYRDLGVAAAVRRYLPDLTKLYAHASEMLTPGRSNNNQRAADLDDVRSILRRTVELLGHGGMNR